MQLATKYGTDSDVTTLLDGFDWMISPVTNPDGYVFSWTTVTCFLKIIRLDFLIQIQYIL